MPITLPFSWGQLSTKELALASLLLAPLTHQGFRLHESYSPHLWFALIIIPPALFVAIASPIESLATFFSFFGCSLAVHAAAIATSVLVYRASPFHPLARIPGPFLARLSKFYMSTVCLGGGQHRHVKQLHERYGDVVRIGPNELSIRDPSAVHALLGPSGVPKGPHFIGRTLSADNQTMIAIQDTEEHLRRRRAWLRGLTSSALKEYEPLIAHRTTMLRDRLLQVASDPKNGGRVALEHWFNFFQYDFMSDMAFGGGSELLSGEEEDRFWTVMEANMRASTFFGHVPWFGVLLGSIPGILSPLKDLLVKGETLARARMARGAARRDLFHYLNHDDSDAPAPPLEQLVDEGLLAVIAGSDTTASSLATIFACLLSSKSVYDALEAEIDQFYPRGADVFDISKHRDMKYLSAVINEALRIFAPVPSGTQRQVPSNGPGTTIGELYIPPGTSLWVHVYSLHRDPRCFSDPDTFRPERWLSVSPEQAGKGKFATEGQFVHDERAFLPFSYGPMNCVGKTLALQELRTVVVALLHRFRFRMAAGDGGEARAFDLKKYEQDFKDFFVTGRPCVEAVLEARQS